MSLGIITAGILGTLAMTLFIEFVCAITHKPFHVIRVLSRTLQFRKSNANENNRLMYWVAVVVHYSIGILFTCCFKLAIEAGLIEFSLSYALIFGALAGLVGIIGWRIAFAIHPAPPILNLPAYLTVIWVGHLVFSLGQYFTFLIVGMN